MSDETEEKFLKREDLSAKIDSLSRQVTQLASENARLRQEAAFSKRKALAAERVLLQYVQRTLNLELALETNSQAIADERATNSQEMAVQQTGE